MMKPGSCRACCIAARGRAVCRVLVLVATYYDLSCIDGLRATESQSGKTLGRNTWGAEKIQGGVMHRTLGNDRVEDTRVAHRVDRL